MEANKLRIETSRWFSGPASVLFKNPNGGAVFVSTGKRPDN